MKIEIKKGESVIEVLSDGLGHCLKIKTPKAVIWPDFGGSVAMYYAFSTSDAHNQLASKRLSQLLIEGTEDELKVEMKNFMQLLAPGSYSLNLFQAKAKSDIQYIYKDRVGYGLQPSVKEWQFVNYYPANDFDLLATRLYSDLDQNRVNYYIDMIKAGGQPKVITLTTEFYEDLDVPGQYTHFSSSTFILDGHHKLLAYRACKVPPHFVNIRREALPGALIKSLFPEIYSFLNPTEQRHYMAHSNWVCLPQDEASKIYNHWLDEYLSTSDFIEVDAIKRLKTKIHDSDKAWQAWVDSKLQILRDRISSGNCFRSHVFNSKKSSQDWYQYDFFNVRSPADLSQWLNEHLATSLFDRIKLHPGSKAIISEGTRFTYQALSTASKAVASTLLGHQSDLNEARVAFMVRPGFDYVKTLLGIWQAGGIAVPLSLHSPFPAIEYVLTDAQCKYLVVDDEFTELLAPAIDSKKYNLIKPAELTTELQHLPEVNLKRRALIIYTSGTTGKPKGVVSTHAIIKSQIETLVEAWHWTEDDHILNILPLHHVHGLVNVLLCALWSGACCEFMKFDASKTLTKLCEGDINLFMAVPTIYYKLIDHWQTLPAREQQQVLKALSQFRLMVSGSAALPVSVMNRWQQISGQVLLERYGMTEIGMAISNPYQGERRAGHIGQALPGVQVELVDENYEAVPEGEPGEILIKGSNVFQAYWNKPEATKEAFTKDGWFKTGDVAILNEGSYRIMGRRSVDIIKSGGYKISALEIEEVLRSHPAVADCAVVGLPDPQWDEIVAAGIVWSKEALTEEDLINWLKVRLPAYQVPRRLLSLDALPRNAMGKVTKPDLKKIF